MSYCSCSKDNAGYILYILNHFDRQVCDNFDKYMDSFYYITNTSETFQSVTTTTTRIMILWRHHYLYVILSDS